MYVMTSFERLRKMLRILRYAKLGVAYTMNKPLKQSAVPNALKFSIDSPRPLLLYMFEYTHAKQNPESALPGQFVW